MSKVLDAIFTVTLNGKKLMPVQGVMLLHHFLAALQQAPRRKQPVDLHRSRHVLESYSGRLGPDVHMEKAWQAISCSLTAKDVPTPRQVGVGQQILPPCMPTVRADYLDKSLPHEGRMGGPSSARPRDGHTLPDGMRSTWLGQLTAGMHAEDASGLAIGSVDVTTGADSSERSGTEVADRILQSTCAASRVPTHPPACGTCQNRPSSEGKGSAQPPATARDLVHFQIDHVFDVAKVGTVVSGTVVRGAIQLGECFWWGPSDVDGTFTLVKVSGIHRSQVRVVRVSAGQYATLALDAAPPATPLSGQWPSNDSTCTPILQGSRATDGESVEGLRLDEAFASAAERVAARKSTGSSHTSREHFSPAAPRPLSPLAMQTSHRSPWGTSPTAQPTPQNGEEHIRAVNSRERASATCTPQVDRTASSALIPEMSTQGQWAVIEVSGGKKHEGDEAAHVQASTVTRASCCASRAMQSSMSHACMHQDVHAAQAATISVFAGTSFPNERHRPEQVTEGSRTALGLGVSLQAPSSGQEGSTAVSGAACKHGVLKAASGFEAGQAPDASSELSKQAARLQISDAQRSVWEEQDTSPPRRNTAGGLQFLCFCSITTGRDFRHA
jgi:hypothetical protein